MVMDEEYPMLEYLIMELPIEDKITALMLPETLQAPNLRHLALRGFVLPIGCRLLTTAAGIVVFCFFMDNPFAYFQPNTLLHWISFLPQLETLVIGYPFPVSNRDVERQLLHTPIIAHVILSNLHWFGFQGASAYIEAIFRRITTPRLEKLRIQFLKQLTFSVPHLLRIMDTTENLRFDSAKFGFSRDSIYVGVYRREEAGMYVLSIKPAAGTSTGRYLPWLKFSTRLVKYPLGGASHPWTQGT